MTPINQSKRSRTKSPEQIELHEVVKRCRREQNFIIPAYTSAHPDDECDVIGRHVAVQFKHLPPAHRIHATDEIQSIVSKYRKWALAEGYVYASADCSFQPVQSSQSHYTGTYQHEDSVEDNQENEEDSGEENQVDDESVDETQTHENSVDETQPNEYYVDGTPLNEDSSEASHVIDSSLDETNEMEAPLNGTFIKVKPNADNEKMAMNPEASRLFLRQLTKLAIDYGFSETALNELLSLLKNANVEIPFNAGEILALADPTDSNENV